MFIVSKWIKVAVFAEKHNVLLNSIYVKRSIGVLPKSIFKKIPKDGLYIDENYINRRNAFKKKVWLESHNNYYFLTKNFSPYYLSKMLNIIDPTKSIDNWNNFMSRYLFSVVDRSYLTYKIKDTLYKFYRYTRWIIQIAFRKLNIPMEKRDILVLIDRD